MLVSSAAKFFSALSLSVGDWTLLLSDMISSCEFCEGMPNVPRFEGFTAAGAIMLRFRGAAVVLIVEQEQ